MQELEKISEEIRKAFEENTRDIVDKDECHHFVVDVCTATYLVNKIIRKHTKDNTDGKNDNNGWIPIDEDNIPDHEVLACNRYAEELIGYIGKDESGFYCESDGEVVGYVTAWMEKPEPYKPERSKE